MVRRLRDRRVEVFAVFLVVFLAWGAYLFKRFLLNPRPITVSTPSSFFRAVEEPVPLRRASRACLDTVAFDPRGGVADFRVLTKGAPPTPLALELTAPGYRARTVVRDYGDGEYKMVPVTPPPKSVLGTACFVNLGRRTVWLSATTEPRIASRSPTRVDGKDVPQHVALTFYERERSSILANTGDILARIAVWAPVGSAFLYVLLVITLLVLPLGLAWAFASSVRPED